MAAAGFKAAALALVCGACTAIATDARTFENTRWHVVAINGRATPPRGDYGISFKSGRISARFGCNSIGGTFSVSRETITAKGLISTLMACGDPAQTFERAGSAVLNAPMRIDWSSSQRLGLSNALGSIELERVSP
jgi:heat shock protein HslJ